MTAYQDDPKTDALFKQVYDELRAMSPDELVTFLQDGETGPVASLIQAAESQTNPCNWTYGSLSVEVTDFETRQDYSWDTNLLVEFAKGVKTDTASDNNGAIAAPDSMAKAA